MKSSTLGMIAALCFTFAAILALVVFLHSNDFLPLVTFLANGIAAVLHFWSYDTYRKAGK